MREFSAEKQFLGRSSNEAEEVRRESRIKKAARVALALFVLQGSPGVKAVGGDQGAEKKIELLGAGVETKNDESWLEKVKKLKDSAICDNKERALILLKAATGREVLEVGGWQGVTELNFWEWSKNIKGSPVQVIEIHHAHSLSGFSGGEISYSAETIRQIRAGKLRKPEMPPSIEDIQSAIVMSHYFARNDIKVKSYIHDPAGEWRLEIDLSHPFIRIFYGRYRSAFEQSVNELTGEEKDIINKAGASFDRSDDSVKEALSRLEQSQLGSSIIRKIEEKLKGVPEQVSDFDEDDRRNLYLLPRKIAQTALRATNAGREENIARFIKSAGRLGINIEYIENKLMQKAVADK